MKLLYIYGYPHSKIGKMLLVLFGSGHVFIQFVRFIGILTQVLLRYQ